MLKKLNDHITDTFADTLGFLHLVVIFGLIYLSFQYIQNKYVLIQYLGELGKHGFLVIFLLFVFYVLFVGALTTLVSINQNLVRMILVLESSEAQKNKNANYSEPVLNSDLKFEYSAPKLEIESASYKNQIISEPKTSIDNLGLKIVYVTLILIGIGITIIWYIGAK